MLNSLRSPYCYDGDVDDNQDNRLGSTRSVRSRSIDTVFLDRDGVINEKRPENHYITSWAHFKLLPGVAKSIAQLNRAGLRVLVVTNQRAVARGLCSITDVDVIHTTLLKVLKTQEARIDAFYVCPHDVGVCTCRKPLTGLFDQAVAQFPDITPASSLVIGDSLSDIEFGHRLGMATFFIEGAPATRKAGGEEAGKLADRRFFSLADATDALLRDRLL